MKNKRLVLSLFLILLLCGSLLPIANCYSTENSYTDSSSDATTPYTEILIVWVDNSLSLLQFKVEMKESWNFTALCQISAYISVDPITGTNWGGFMDFNFDYIIISTPSLTEDRVHFLDINNGTNDLDEGEDLGMAFSLFSNNNKTIEFGWKLKTYYNGKGYLNLSIGQTIQIKFYAAQDSDFAPDIGLGPMNYTLEWQSDPNNQISGFNAILITTWSIGTIIALMFIKKYKKY